MNIKKISYTLKEEEPETIIYLLLSYYLYDKMEVNFRSKAKKIIILLKNNSIPENYKKHFEIHYVETKNKTEIKNLIEKILKDKNKKKTKIVASDEEFIYLSASIAKEFKIQGISPEKALHLTNKVKMKNLVRKNKIPTHLYVLISKEKIKEDINSYMDFLKKEINYPMFIKPTELFGSRGTQKINNEKELKKILIEISEDEIEYEIDEYVSNTIINCEVVVINGKMVFFRTRILNNSLHTFCKGINYSSCIVSPSHQEYKKAFVMVTRLIEAFKDVFENRCINFEFIEQNQENLLFLEFNYRRPGTTTCYIIDYQFENGFNYEVLDLDLVFGAKNVEVYQDDFKSEYDFYSGNILFPGKKGVIKSFEKLPEDLSSEIKIELKLKIGDEMEETVNNAYIPAYIIIRNKCFKALYREIQRLRSWYPYVLE